MRLGYDLYSVTDWAIDILVERVNLSFILHPSSFILHPSSFILHPYEQIAKFCHNLTMATAIYPPLSSYFFLDPNKPPKKPLLVDLLLESLVEPE